MSNEELLYWLEQESVSNTEAFLPADTPLGTLSGSLIKSRLEGLRRKHQRTIERLINQQAFALADFQAAFAERTDAALFSPEKKGFFEFVYGDQFLVEKQDEIMSLLTELQKPVKGDEAPKTTQDTRGTTDTFTKSIKLVYESELEELRNRQKRLFEEFQTDYVEQKATLEKQLAQISLQREPETESTSTKRIRISPQTPHRDSPPLPPPADPRIGNVQPPPFPIGLRISNTPLPPSASQQIGSAPSLTPSVGPRVGSAPLLPPSANQRAGNPPTPPLPASRRVGKAVTPPLPAGHRISKAPTPSPSVSHRVANPSPTRKLSPQQQPSAIQGTANRALSRDPRIQNAIWNAGGRPPEVASSSSIRPPEVGSALKNANHTKVLKKMIRPPEATSFKNSSTKLPPKHITGSLIDNGIIDIFGSELVLVERNSKAKLPLGSTKDFDEALHSPHFNCPIYIRNVNGEKFFCRKKDHAKIAPVSKLEPMIRNHLLRT